MNDEQPKTLADVIGFWPSKLLSHATAQIAPWQTLLAESMKPYAPKLKSWNTTGSGYSQEVLRRIADNTSWPTQAKQIVPAALASMVEPPFMRHFEGMATKTIPHGIFFSKH